MAKPTRSTTVITLVVVVAGLVLAKDLLLPLFLAGFLAFLLAPMAAWLERRAHLSESLAALGAVLVGATVLVGASFVITTQVGNVVNDLPTYGRNLKAKLGAVRGLKTKLQRVAADLEAIEETVATEGEAPGAERGATDDENAASRAAVPVEVVERRQGRIVTWIGKHLSVLLSFLGTLAVVIVFVPFFLLARKSLRNRLIALLRDENVFLTAHAVDEATERVSSYLVAMLTVNILYAIPVATILYVLGLPNALLWGFVAMLLRFVPYLGPWTAAILIMAVAASSDPGWDLLWGSALLLVCIELVVNNFVEPWLYGRSTGLSTLAVLMAAFFWGWAWGIPGLFLAMPISLCLAVVGRYVPSLGFFHILLTNSDHLDRHTPLFQRLVIGDGEGAALLAQEAVAQEGWTATLDQALVPTLRLIEQEHQEQLLDGDHARSMAEDLAELSENLPTNPDSSSPDLGVVHVDTGPEATYIDEAHARVLRAGLRALGANDSAATGLASPSVEVTVVDGYDPVVHAALATPDAPTALFAMRRPMRHRVGGMTERLAPSHAVASAADLIKRLTTLREGRRGTQVANTPVTT